MGQPERKREFILGTVDRISSPTAVEYLALPARAGSRPSAGLIAGAVLLALVGLWAGFKRWQRSRSFF